MVKFNIKHLFWIISLILILIIGIVLLLNLDKGCTNQCATDFNQKPSPSCLCYSDRDNDNIPDIIDLQPDIPLIPIEEGDEGFIDSDGDGWADEDEISWGSDPNDENDFPYQDMDGDGFYDEEELFYGTDPNDANDFPVFEEETIESEITPPPEEPPFTGCTDSDAILNLENQIITSGSCQDSAGIHLDECLINSNTISEWQCENGMCKRTNLDCIDWLGTGAVCATGNDICTTPITFTALQCFELKNEQGKSFSAIEDNQDACDDQALFTCNLHGQTTGAMDWFPSNCCLFDCQDL